ncbi:MAG TPA: hypothetical protein VGO47_13215 [Chlamydiales bacterium]|nr:hypothetical protein [Chlamydiales bacterium]
MSAGSTACHNVNKFMLKFSNHNESINTILNHLIDQVIITGSKCATYLPKPALSSAPFTGDIEGFFPGENLGKT